MADKKLVPIKYLQLDDAQKLNWLRLIRSQNVGPVTFKQLISHFGTASEALNALPDLARRGGSAARIKICPLQDAEREYALSQKLGARFIGLGEPDYPNLLRNCEDGPPLLCVAGSAKTLTRKLVAMVGSRNASISGMKLTQRFASELGEAGYAIVSGLARGIDTAAHKASIRNGTIAVFAGGTDVIYPPENRELVSEILDHDGAIISEMPMGWRPRAKDFPRRNRIVTGVSNGVVVVEAAKRSGSLISARLANEMGRVVLAVPGSPLDPRSEGTNDLIRKGATLVTSTADILEAIRPLDEEAMSFDYDLLEDEDWYASKFAENQQDPDEQMRESVIASLGPAPTLVDDIIDHTGASHAEIQLILIELSLAGRLEYHSGNRVSLVQ